MAIYYVPFGLIVLTVLVFALWYRNYRAYVEYLKAHHPAEPSRLIRKDALVDQVGPWTRWPVGSAGPLLSLWASQETYGDRRVKDYKRRSWRYSVLLVGLFLGALGLSFLLTPR